MSKFLLHSLFRNLTSKLSRFTRIDLSITSSVNSTIGSTVDKEKFCWHQSNQIPSLTLINATTNEFTPGWYSLQLASKHENTGHQLAELSIEESNEKSILLPLRPNKVTTRFFYLSTAIPDLELTPTDIQGKFELTALKLFKIPVIYALHRQIVRIANLHPDFNGGYFQTVLELRTKAQKTGYPLSKTVLKIYNQTFTDFKIDKNYSQWIEKTEQPKLEKFLKTKLCTFDLQPTISILLPTYNTNPKLLEECIQSVIAQTYPSWQLCIVDDASHIQKHINIIQTLAKKDDRIIFQARSKNGHISQASNDALEMATGEYTLLLDHDDLLTPNTLKIFVDAINKHPEAKLFYADEDKINDDNYRFMPHFKPDWNPDLLYSQNYIGHPVIYKTKKLKQIGGFRLGVEGSQDHDLLLRYTDNLTSDEIIHLPWILYHWRATETSTAQNTDSKDYTTQAGIKSLQDFFHHKKIDIKVKAGQYPNTYRCKWPLPSQPPLVSLLIPTRDGYDILKTCLESILEKTTYKNFEILVLNNQTTCPKTLALFKSITVKHANLRILDWNQPFNYSAINNYGVEHAKGEIIGLINNDIEVITHDWLTEMVSHAIRPEIGCVGAKLFYPNDTIQHAGVILGIGGVAGHSHKYFNRQDPGYFSRLQLTQNLSAVTAACLLVRKSIFKEVNGLDEENLTVAFNDVDFCLKVREAGYRNLWTPYAELYHHESISRGADDNPQKQKRAHQEISFMKHKWHTQLQHDPAYNRNLSLTYENFSLK